MDMMQLGRQIASLMGGNYSATNYKQALNNNVVIRNLATDSDPEFGILLTHYVGTKKIRIGGTYPIASDGREFPYDFDKPSNLLVTETKQPHLIARDITNKFMPAYLPVFQKAVADRQAHEIYLLKRKILAQHFAKILHGKVLESGDRIDGGPSINAQLDKRGYVNDFYVSGSTDTVDLHLNRIPADMAEKMLAVWLDGWKPECRNCHHFLDDNDICRYRECSLNGQNGT